MLESNHAVSFIATADATAARFFYEEKLGLTFLADEDFSLVFDLNGHILRISKVDSLLPAKHTVLGWKVNDIEDTVRVLIERGVIFETYDSMLQDELCIWKSPSGASVAWFKDTDGNILSITQLESGDAA